MKTFTKHILLLALMLFGVAGAAWASRAPQKFTGPVAKTDLVEGDTLAPGFSITGLSVSNNLGFDGNRYKQGGVLGNGNMITNGNTVTGYGGDNPVAITISETILVTPVDESGHDGNAWVVTYNSSSYVFLSGIYIAPDPTVPALDELTGNWNFLMPGANKVVKVTYKAEPALAWTFGNRAIPNDTTITAYRGFELPVIGNIGAIMNHDFYTALLGGTVSLRYGSTNPAVISFTNPNNMWSFSVNGAGECNVYMVFDGNDDFQYDSVAFHAVIANPYTLTLAKEGNGTVSPLLGGATWTTETWANLPSDQNLSPLTFGDITISTTGSLKKYSDYNPGKLSFFVIQQDDTKTLTFSSEGDNFTRIEMTMVSEYSQYNPSILPADGWTFDGHTAVWEGDAPSVTVTSCSTYVDQITFTRGIDSIVATATEGQYLVIPGATVQVVAEAQDGNYVSAWSPINRTPENLLSDTATFTVGETMTLTATFAQNPTLTLSGNEGGEVEMGGVTYDTVYTITFNHHDSPSGSRAITIPASRFPYDTIFNYGSAEVMDPYASEPSGKLSIIAQGEHTVTLRISGAFEGTGNYGCRVDGFDIWSISCTASTQPKMPYGITKTGNNTYLVLPGTEVTVTATPDSAHYLSRIDGLDTVSNHACGYSFVMPGSDYPLMADFTTKPTLTLAQTDGGTLEAIVAQGGGEETLLGTFTGGSTTIDGIATLNPNGAEYDQFTGWGIYTNNTDMTVTIAEGVNVTKVKFIGDAGGYYEDTEAPYQVTLYQGYEGFTNAPYEDVASIEVYGYQNVTPNVIASSTPNTYIIDYGTPVTVVATPDAQHYLVRFSDDDPATERNSNIAVEKTYDSVIADIPLSANFQAKPVLTLTANDGGTLTLDGMVEPTPATAQLSVPGSWAEDFNHVSPTNMPTDFQAVDENVARAWQNTTGKEVYLIFAEDDGEVVCYNFYEDGSYDESSFKPFRASIYELVGDGGLALYTTGAIGGMPAGVVSANATRDTIVVDYGTEVTVTATPDSIHYLKNFSGFADTNSNTAVAQTYTITDNTTATANFAQKPTLTLAHNDGGEMEAIVPEAEPVLLTTITATGESTYSQSPDGIVTVTLNNTSNYSSTYGWLENGTVTVEAAQGYTITRCVFKQGDKTPLVDDLAPFTATMESFNVSAETSTGQENSGVMDGISSIEVYGYQNVTPNVTASTEPNTYYIDYNTSVTVKATPSDTAYLVRFDNDADTNSNTAVEKTYGPLTAALTTAEATFNDKPVLTLAQNEADWGKVEIPIGLVATDPTPAPTPTAVANPVITGVLMPDGSMQVTMSCTTQDADIYYTTDGVTSPLCDCPAAPEYTQPITITEPVTIMAAAYTGNDWSAVVTKTITLGLPAGVAKLTDTTYCVDYGASVTVQAIPDSAHYLVRFDNDADTNSNVAVEKTYQNITADVTSEALFAPKPKLTLAKTRTMDDTDDWGSVSFNPLQYPWLGTSQNTGPLFLTDEPDVYVVDYGATVTVTADATELHHVANWVDADSAAYPADRITYSAYFVTEPVALFPDSSTLTLTITADTTAKAVFGINSYDVFATAQLDDRDEIGTGTAMGYLNVSYKDIVGTTQTAGPEDTLDYTAQGGSLSTITSTSYYGYRFSGWYDADMDTLMSSVNPLTLTEAAVVEARYTPINYTITGLSEDDEMGTVTGGGTLPYRTPVSLTAVPERGYHFTGWDNGLSANPLELAAMSDFTVTASFAPNQYTVTVLSGDETMGSASGSTVADFHTTVTLTATPNAHYHFVAWSNGVTDTVTELLVDGDTTVTALFAADEYTITGLSADSTMGSVSGSATVTYPATVTLTATAANCHHFVQWNDGVTANPRTVNALEDLTLTATFAASTYASSEDVTTCDNYTWNNVTYTASGTYTYNTTTLAGCDSTATLHLTLITGIETEEVVEACESYEWHGVVYTQSTGILGAPTYTTTALNGCDSTVTLRLTINHGTTAVETVEACDSYTWNGRTYFSSTTTATYTTEGSNGCDSTTTLHLTLGRSTSGELNVEACESYTWHGVTYTESIVGPTDTNLNTSGCPHVTTLHLTILRNSSSEETVEACDVYNWHGVNRYASGDYVFLSPNAVGCDSTAILHLTIRRSTHAEEIAAACDEYEWHGILFTESADTTLHTLNAAGCDSAMTLHLTLYYNSEATDVVTACDSYTWIDGVTYTASTDEPTYTIAGANCSTTVTLNLTVNYSTAGIDEQEAVDSYTWINGITYTASTDQPTFVLTNAAGCDSVVTLHLTITYTPEPVYYNVTLATADATMGSVAPAGTTVIEEGLSFTATATALTGRHFVAWVSNGTVVSDANPYTFVVNDDVELTATFDYDEVIAVLTVNDETMGTTTPAPGTYTFHVGDEATVTATANEHYHFVGWTVNGTPINTQETTYTVTVTPEMAGTTFYVEAVFAQNEGIDDNEGTLEATVYAQEGQIVVEGAGNSTVVLYDVTGRRLAVKHSDNAPLRFDIAVSGTYLVKVGNAPAKRIVMVR